MAINLHRTSNILPTRMNTFHAPIYSPLLIQPSPSMKHETPGISCLLHLFLVFFSSPTGSKGISGCNRLFMGILLPCRRFKTSVMNCFMITRVQDLQVALGVQEVNILSKRTMVLVCSHYDYTFYFFSYFGVIISHLICYCHFRVILFLVCLCCCCGLLL